MIQSPLTLPGVPSAVIRRVPAWRACFTLFHTSASVVTDPLRGTALLSLTISFKRNRRLLFNRSVRDIYILPQHREYRDATEATSICLHTPTPARPSYLFCFCFIFFIAFTLFFFHTVQQLGSRPGHRTSIAHFLDRVPVRVRKIGTQSFAPTCILDGVITSTTKPRKTRLRLVPYVAFSRCCILLSILLLRPLLSQHSRSHVERG